MCRLTDCSQSEVGLTRSWNLSPLFQCLFSEPVDAEEGRTYTLKKKIKKKIKVKRVKRKKRQGLVTFQPPLHQNPETC